MLSACSAPSARRGDASTSSLNQRDLLLASKRLCLTCCPLTADDSVRLLSMGRRSALTSLARSPRAQHARASDV